MLKNRVEAVIDTANLKHNFMRVRELAEDSRIISVVKADAYGHGAVECAHIIEECGGDMFAVASAEEGAALRKSGIRGDILVLGVSLPAEQKLLGEYDLIQTVSSREYAKTLVDAGVPVRIHIKTDTGMSRLGLYCHEKEDIPSAFKDVKEILSSGLLHCEGVFTHFACSDVKENNMTEKQFEVFNEFCNYASAHGLDLGMRHCCNSAAIINFPQMRLDGVRAGIILYGLSPAPSLMAVDGFKPCMSFVTNVVQLSHIKKGDVVSYGASFVAESDMTAATLSVGYADGLPRALSGKASVIINGKKAKLIGKICMDMCIADVTDICCSVGDEAIVFGEEQSVDGLADIVGTINYELICSVRNRVTRRYK